MGEDIACTRTPLAHLGKAITPIRNHFGAISSITPMGLGSAGLVVPPRLWGAGAPQPWPLRCAWAPAHRSP
ncbi:MAG: hypothetical protein EAY75_02650 [Bacteroidetes bacterium]|nr:MAG: hypothetical protein EAY75_02650 [Bacteroidota bacterium]